METLQAIGAGENIPALIERNRRLPRTNGIAAGYGGLGFKTGQGWRKAFRPVLDAAGRGDPCRPTFR